MHSKCIDVVWWSLGVLMVFSSISTSLMLDRSSIQQLDFKHSITHSRPGN